MPRRSDDYHAHQRFGWRIDRLKALHELGRAFGLTEDAKLDPPADDAKSDQVPAASTPEKPKP